VAGGVALLVIAGLVWWMFRPEPATVDEIPVVSAEPGEVKTRPADEGGMDVPNRDISVYEQIGSQPSDEPEVVMPAPETPIAPAGTEVVTTEPAAGPEEDAADRAQSEIDAVLAQLQASSAAADAIPQPVGEAPSTTTVASQPAAQPVPEQPAGEQAATDQPSAEQPQVAALPADEPAAAQATPPATGVRIQLAAFKSEDQARGAWSGMQQRFPNELGGLPLIIEQADLGAKGVFYRVQTGPLASREAAVAMCDRLKVQGQTCIVAQ
jgi:cell division septation protein DedD